MHVSQNLLIYIYLYTIMAILIIASIRVVGTFKTLQKDNKSERILTFCSIFWHILRFHSNYNDYDFFLMNSTCSLT